MKKMSLASLMVVYALILTCGLPNPLWAQKEAVSFRCDFIAAGYHAPFAVAIQKGFYSAEGLTVKMGEGTGSATTVKLVANGSDTFGLADGGTMYRAVAQEGIPVKAVFGFAQKSPLAMVTLKESGITKVEQLKGKTIAVVPGGADSQMLPAFLGAARLNPGDVKVANVDANLKLQVLMDKKADAIVGWFNQQIPQLEVRGYEVNSVMLSDFGINSMSLVVMASRKTIDGNPEMAKKFVAATIKGLEYAKAHPEESIASLRQQFPNLNELIGLKQLLATFTLARTRNTEGKPSGWMALKDWEDTQELLIKFAGMKDKIDPATAFTNQFIP